MNEVLFSIVIGQLFYLVWRVSRIDTTLNLLRKRCPQLNGKGDECKG